MSDRSPKVSRRTILAGSAAAGFVPLGVSREAKAWVATWAAPPTSIPPGEPRVLHDQTVRHVAHTSIGGDQLRVRLSNEFGAAPLRIGEVRVGLRSGDDASTDVARGSSRRVLFSGRRDVTLPAGAPAVSDPVDLVVPDGADLVVSLYLPDPSPVTTLFAFAYQDNVIAAGNVTGAAHVTPSETIGQVLFLSGLSVRTRGSAIVTLGDSITNGAITRTNANHRWPDLFAARLRASGRRHGVANVGISGNRLLHDPDPPPGPAEAYAAYFGQSALRRFDRDVLAQPAAEHLIVLLGVNDLGHPGTSAPPSETVSAAEIIGGHRQLIARAHTAGIQALGATILPFRGDSLGFWSPENERKRAAVNRWIRSSGEYDGVIDFDAATRDPADPLRLRPDLNSGDGLHPNDAGMAAMAAVAHL
ncbi:SGNH/GDSL hydrolase family protein [Actinoplanes sp. NBRC 103695]|uniref:SGNH/GDSL hydrolase family protein n=1 Tax=Actinoplanes sp. NBRC 103695 TaxID=3032202 RepID=UPI002554473A|nr:SGNH/GDSL hydrolase family protein [Actinoplanes sp. NBRC 103695]